MVDGIQGVMVDAGEGLALMRKPFPDNCISKLPKPTKRQTEEVRADYKRGIRCKVCGGWHHPKVVHLDYVGHAALTDRLLDCDPEWNWRALATGPEGAPLLDQNGGLWIELTVCGMSRNGYGHADGKTGGDAIKEAIGDALRNAAMRFGAALDLWHKGDLHPDVDKGGETDPPAPKPSKRLTKANSRDLYQKLQTGLRNQSSVPAINKWLVVLNDELEMLPVDQEKELRQEAADEIAGHEANTDNSEAPGF